ncbi:hypothetical protein [Ligilactobacillus salivarius]|uniref:hypothetical protein n=1 Tax=Ligilactobacillus salivarius TaxID=1624 RepID=UPI001879332A|nr:hypothetical protein [Ligilactobacillus salivarius]MBE7388200.1 hypothetical protein [Ligilactobacillus salivarius]MBE7392764.1 hypothetical protein [Ligilactobacillus salivarius]
MESTTSPIIKVYLTDSQFKELKQDLLDKFSIDLVNNLIDKRIEKEQAPPYVKIIEKNLIYNGDEVLIH